MNIISGFSLVIIRGCWDGDFTGSGVGYGQIGGVGACF